MHKAVLCPARLVAKGKDQPCSQLSPEVGKVWPQHAWHLASGQPG